MPALILGAVCFFIAGMITGAAIAWWFALGRIGDQQAIIDELEASHWPALNHPADDYVYRQ